MTRNSLFKRFRESFFLFGLACLVWYVVRTGTKPSRASYPCQKAAAFNANLWAVTYVFPVLSVDKWKGYLKRRWKPIAIILVVVALSAGYMSTRDDGSDDGGMSPDILSLIPMTASETPQSNIYAVTGTDGADGGVQALIELMAENGQPFYRSAEEDDLQGPSGLIDAGDVVLIKINSQWDERGGTNTDLVKNLIEALLAHPDGFKGEVVVADNGQKQYGGDGNGGSLDWRRSNALDHGQSMQDVVDMYADRGVSSYLWDTITENVVSEFADGDMEDGYVVSTSVTSTGVMVSYPKFTTPRGTRISFKYGVYLPDENDYDVDRLKVLNVPVLKTHCIYGVTGAVKHYMGVPSDKLTASLGYRTHDTVDEGGMGTLMAQTRVPTLNIVDAIWVNAVPGDGPSTSYGSATEVNVIAASVDPVALDYWASKNILCQACGGDTRTMDPDNTERGGFGDWLRLSLQELNAAGLGFTCDENAMNVYVSANG